MYLLYYSLPNRYSPITYSPDIYLPITYSLTTYSLILCKQDTIILSIILSISTILVVPIY